ncbi:MAG TPA: amidohydrolase family protein [Cyclobacteriaceae bacterium]|nr:amidohydrolase family protein [Cyclobacteriaceae bacterium]
MLKTLLSFFVVLTTFTSFSQKPKWDVANPAGWNFKEVNLSTNEGTWMNLDVSPDGKEIVFDLMGDIFIMPVTGGDAKILRGGFPFEVQPRFSPDGKWISFTSDAGGGDNIWIMKRDGTEPKQVTKEDFRLLNNSVWSADGNYIIARKHFTSTRSLGAGEMWMYHRTGGNGLQLTKRKNDQQDVNEPSVSPDGKYLYYSEDVYPGGFFQYNKDPNQQIYAIYRYSFEDGRTEQVTGGAGGACRPQVSRDSKKLAFVRRVREQSVLFIHDLATGEEKPVYSDLHKDQQESWAIFGAYTGFAWTPDNSAIIVWAKGKIRRIDVNTLAASDIPFNVNTTLKIADALHFKNDAFQEEFTATAVRHVTTSPDGKTLLFNAAGYLWKKDLPDGVPQRLTTGTDLEFEGSFSANGNEVVFVTWNDETLGSIQKLNLKTKGAKPARITTQKAIYRQPKFSNDGSRIIYVKGDGNDHQGNSFGKEPGIYWMSSNGGTATKVREDGTDPRFNADGTRIYFMLRAGASRTLRSSKLDGSDERTHLSSKSITGFAVSPDEKWVAFVDAFKAYIAAMPAIGRSVDVDSKTSDYPVSQIARDAGYNLHWSPDSKKIMWNLGDQYFVNEIKNRFVFLDGSPTTVPKTDSVGLKIGLKIKSDVPNGRVAFTNARIITMEGNEVIENGTIVINKNKIEAIGATGQVQVPGDAKVVDAKGKTIIPGLVDAHAHIGNFRYGLSPQKQWQYFVNVAYGVTTSHDPSSNSEMIFSQSEMIKAGNMVGPRLFSTGTILYGAEGDAKTVVNSLDDARAAIRRTKAFGAFSVKSYNQPRREQRQQIIQASRELNIEVVPEGGATFYHNMTMIMDGHTGVEHNIPVSPVYKDVITLWSNSQSGYTPTLIVNYAGMSGEYYWYQHTNVWENEKLLKFTPRSVIDARSRHRMMVPEKEYEVGHIATSKVCNDLSNAGVKINAGAHGQIQGIGLHWELWMLGQGGMKPHDVLKAGTINGASYLGMSDQIGSLKVGKLADLVVLDKNPLEGLQNTNSVSMTMINGRLYDTNTMNEIGNYNKPRSKFYWEQAGYSEKFPWHEESESYGCVCGKH